MSEKHYLEVIERILYELSLSDDCFYIGQAQKKSYEGRMKSHFDLTLKSRKSVWVKEHPALLVIETIDFFGTYPECEVLENKKTIEYMKRYGVSKIRGGYYTNADNELVIKCLNAHGYKVSSKR